MYFDRSNFCSDRSTFLSSHYVPFALEFFDVMHFFFGFLFNGYDIGLWVGCLMWFLDLGLDVSSVILLCFIPLHLLYYFLGSMQHMLCRCCEPCDEKWISNISWRSSETQHMACQCRFRIHGFWWFFMYI